MQKQISIIIATYNSGKTLESCLLSVVREKDDLVELIVIDGGSTDDSIDILNRFAQEIDHVVSEPDQGIYDAWNKGIHLSTGKWLMFVGSDDQLRAGVIKRYRREIPDLEDVDYISARIMLVDGNQRNLASFGQEYRWESFRTAMNVSHVGALHNRRLYETYGYYDTSFKICGDYELLLRPKCKLKAKFIDAIVADMAVGGVSYGPRALIETRDAKLKNKVKSKFFIFLDYYYSWLKLSIKKRVGLLSR